MEENKATIVLFSGDMDKVFAAFTIATDAAAAGMDTTVFCTFWGLNALRNDHRTGQGLMGKLLGLLNRGGLGRLGPSKLNFGGMGRWMFKKMMNSKGVASLEELRDVMVDLGVHLLACKTSMGVMEITRDDLIEEVEGIVGVAKMIQEASGSSIQLFI